MAISRDDFRFFITELVKRNPTMGIPALEDGLFASLLIVDDLYVFLYFLEFVLEAYRLWEVSHLFCCEISRRMQSESCLGTPWEPRYDQIYKNLHFSKG